MKKSIPAIEWLRQREQLDVLVIIEGDTEMLKIIAAWKMTSPMVSGNAITFPNEPQSLDEGLRHVWDIAGLVNYGHISALTGIPENVIERRLHVLQSACLIYPDGTISKGAQALLAQRVRDILKMPQAPEK